jgi:hypothetical protein
LSPGIMTLSIMTLVNNDTHMTLGIITRSIIRLSIIILSIMTHSIMMLNVITPCIKHNDTQH